jgi:hypothetical protein
MQDGVVVVTQGAGEVQDSRIPGAGRGQKKNKNAQWTSLRPWT